MASKNIDYYLEIYEEKECLAVFRASTPFMPFSIGDLIGPAGFMPDALPSLRLRVMRIERIIWENDDHIGDKSCVYTEAVDLAS